MGGRRILSSTDCAAHRKVGLAATARLPRPTYPLYTADRDRLARTGVDIDLYAATPLTCRSSRRAGKTQSKGGYYLSSHLNSTFSSTQNSESKSDSLYQTLRAAKLPHSPATGRRNRLQTSVLSQTHRQNEKEHKCSKKFANTVPRPGTARGKYSQISIRNGVEPVGIHTMERTSVREIHELPEGHTKASTGGEKMGTGLPAGTMSRDADSLEGDNSYRALVLAAAAGRCPSSRMPPRQASRRMVTSPTSEVLRARALAVSRTVLSSASATKGGVPVPERCRARPVATARGSPPPRLLEVRPASPPPHATPSCSGNDSLRDAPPPTVADPPPIVRADTATQPPKLVCLKEGPTPLDQQRPHPAVHPSPSSLVLTPKPTMELRSSTKIVRKSAPKLVLKRFTPDAPPSPVPTVPLIIATGPETLGAPSHDPLLGNISPKKEPFLGPNKMAVPEAAAVWSAAPVPAAPQPAHQTADTHVPAAADRPPTPVPVKSEHYPRSERFALQELLGRFVFPFPGDHPSPARLEAETSSNSAYSRSTSKVTCGLASITHMDIAEGSGTHQ